MLKRKTVDKRFVDYVFLAGLPPDFRINPKEQKSLNHLSSSILENDKLSNELNGKDEYNSTEEIIEDLKSKENDTMKTKEDGDNGTITKDFTDMKSTPVQSIVTSDTTIPDNNDNDDSNTFETFNVSKKLFERYSKDLVIDDDESKRLFDSLFESIRVNILKFDQERDEFLKSLGKEIREIKVPSISARKSFNKIVNGGDDSVTSTEIKDLGEELLETDSIISSNDIQEKSNDIRSSYQNVVPQQPSSKQNVVDSGTLLHPLKQRFSPKLLSRYPKNDYPKEGTFPAYVPMVIFSFIYMCVCVCVIFKDKIIIKKFFFYFR
jgi:hypothetical protein